MAWREPYVSVEVGHVLFVHFFRHETDGFARLAGSSSGSEEPPAAARPAMADCAVARDGGRAGQLVEIDRVGPGLQRMGSDLPAPGLLHPVRSEVCHQPVRVGVPANWRSFASRGGPIAAVGRAGRKLVRRYVRRARVPDRPGVGEEHHVGIDAVLATGLYGRHRRRQARAWRHGGIASVEGLCLPANTRRRRWLEDSKERRGNGSGRQGNHRERQTGRCFTSCNSGSRAPSRPPAGRSRPSHWPCSP